MITAVIVLLLCNWYSRYSLGQILYYYQLITHFNPLTIRAATVLYMNSYGQIALAITRAITGHTCTSKSTDYCPNCTQKGVINYTNCIAQILRFVCKI